MPSKNKYIQFKNIQNTLKLPFVCYADIESYMIKKDEKTETHNHLKSRYLLNCLDSKYSKKCKIFDKMEDFRDNLIEELDYIEKINDNVFNYPIDMSTFDQKIFDEITHCKYCNYDFKEKYNNR